MRCKLFWRDMVSPPFDAADVELVELSASTNCESIGSVLMRTPSGSDDLLSVDGVVANAAAAAAAEAAAAAAAAAVAAAFARFLIYFNIFINLTLRISQFSTKRVLFV